MSVLLLPNNVQALAPLVAKESARYALTGFRIEETKLEKATKYRVEATNGRVLGRIEGIADDASEYPVNVVPGLATAPNTATSAVVPAKPFIEMCKKAKSSKAPKAILKNVACVLSTDQVTLASTDLEHAGGMQTTRIVEGRWPATDEVISKKKPQRSFFIDPQLMIDVLKAASEVRDMPESVSVRLDIFEGENACIEVKSFKPGQRFLGIIVPLTKGSKDDEKKWDRSWHNVTDLIGECTVPVPDEDDEEAESDETENEKAASQEEEATEEVSNPAEPEAGDEVDNPQPAEPAEPQAEVIKTEYRPSAKTPIEQQFLNAKERHPDAILLFRMGDFYEAFSEDARTLAEVCQLTLTVRDTMAMAGFPYHSLETHLKSLVVKGHRVAVCEPVVEPEPVKVSKPQVPQSAFDMAKEMAAKFAK